MPSTFVRPESVELDIKFRFLDDPEGTRRKGQIYEIQRPEVREGCKKYNPDYQNMEHHQIGWALKSQLNWCVNCSRQAKHLLVFRNYGVLQVQKFCSSCIQKNIIRL